MHLPHQQHHCPIFFTNLNLLCCCHCLSIFYAHLPAQPQSNTYHRRVGCSLDPIMPKCQINYLNHLCSSNITDVGIGTLPMIITLLAAITLVLVLVLVLPTLVLVLVLVLLLVLLSVVLVLRLVVLLTSLVMCSKFLKQYM